MLRKTWFWMVVFCLCGCTSTHRLPPSVAETAIEENGQIAYSPSAGRWNNRNINKDRIIFTKHTSSGSGSYSEYAAGTTDFSPNSTYEFLHDGRLIGYNEHDLYFTEVVYQNGRFETKRLSPYQVSQLFPGVEIVQLSSIQNGVVTVNKPWFGSKIFLLLNDTDNSYYRYSFEGVQQGNPFKSLLTVNEPGDIRFSHYGSDNTLFPALRIRVEN